MSVRIGDVFRSNGDEAAYIAASRGGVEIDAQGLALPSLEPVAARNFAALLVRAADEVERMRERRES